MNRVRAGWHLSRAQQRFTAVPSRQFARDSAHCSLTYPVG